MKWRIAIAILAMLGIAGVAPATERSAPIKTTTTIVQTTPGIDGCTEVCWD